jgi:hypothetical protein
VLGHRGANRSLVSDVCRVEYRAWEIAREALP